MSEAKDQSNGNGDDHGLFLSIGRPFCLRQGNVALLLSQGIWSPCADYLATCFSSEREATIAAQAYGITDVRVSSAPVNRESTPFKYGDSIGPTVRVETYGTILQRAVEKTKLRHGKEANL